MKPNFLILILITSLIGCSSTTEIKSIKPLKENKVETKNKVETDITKIIEPKTISDTIIVEPSIPPRSTADVGYVGRVPSIKNNGSVKSKSRMKSRVSDLNRIDKLPKKEASKNVDPTIEIIYDKTTYTIPCEFFNYDLSVKEAEKGLKDNIYISSNNISNFINDYIRYKTSFNEYILECSKPKTVLGTQKNIDSIIVREEIVETITTECKKFDIKPIENSFDNWIYPTQNMIDLGLATIPVQIERKIELYGIGLLSAEDILDDSEYNKKDLDNMMSQFKKSVDEYNKDKKGELYSPKYLIDLGF